MPNHKSWTDKEEAYLLQNYKLMGDVELAKEFTKMQSSGRIFTLKMVEKKRYHMKLNRTKKMVDAIRARNKANGAWRSESANASRYLRRYPEGKTVIQKANEYPRLMVKQGSKMVHLPKLLYEQKHGTLPQGYVLRCKTQDKTNPNPDNWEAITLHENAYRNTRIWKEKCPEIFEVMEAYRKMKIKLAHKTKKQIT